LTGPTAMDSRCDVVRRHGAGRVYRRKGSSRYWIQYSIGGHQYREPGGATPAAARRKLRDRLREAGTERFAGPAAERVTVHQLADALLVHMENQRRASVDKIRSHLKPLRAFFASRLAIDITTASLERYERQRLDAGMAPATVNREVHALRRAFNVAARQTPALFPKHLVPYFPSLPVDNVRSGFFERAEVETLLQHVEDDGIRDFIAWAFRTGMRKGEIARLTWDMLDRTGTPWVLRIPGAITKNRTGRTLGLEGEVKAIIERRLRVRRFNNPLIFHRVAKGKPGQPITDFWEVWKDALQPPGCPQDGFSTTSGARQSGR
jgi:integrase